MYDFASASPVKVLGPALYLRDMELAKKALAHFDSDSRISMLEERWIANLPMRDLLHLMGLQERAVGYYNWSWSKLLKEFVSDFYSRPGRDRLKD